ncbi:MAG: hypothetical protein EPN22_06090 [Nitrospirae bacterium]|nr:MAG: hypothetical protein EPN22_06090 [Nitrospirota bacterium]
MKTNNIRSKAFLLSANMLLLFLFHGTALPATLQEKYKPVKIAEKVKPAGSSVAWSRDNRFIAFPDDGLNIYDTTTGSSKKIDMATAYHVIWADDNVLFVLYKKGADKKLCAADIKRLKCEDIPINKAPEAVFPIMDSKKLLVVSAQLKTASLWSDVYYELSIHDLASDLTRTIYRADRTLLTKNPSIDFLSGWISMGVSPYDTTFLTMEYVKPPIFPPHLKIGVVDYMTGKTKNIGQAPHNKFSVQGSWSPDGRRFAFPDQKGRLTIMNIAGESITPDKEVAGRHPSWNPVGSQIFIGGHIIDADGSRKVELAPKGADTKAYWSPDGTKMALLIDESLWLLDGFKPSIISPDRLPDKNLLKKLLLLKELFTDKLISEEDYDSRYMKLLEKDGQAK